VKPKQIDAELELVGSTPPRAVELRRQRAKEIARRARAVGCHELADFLLRRTDELLEAAIDGDDG
jgi:hypothetical protein